MTFLPLFFAVFYRFTHAMEEAVAVSSPLILTNIHTLNQHVVRVNGLGPWTDHLDMSAPEGLETFGSRTSIDIFGQDDGQALVSHGGTGFIGIFRPGDFTIDMVYPPQVTFTSAETQLPFSDIDGELAQLQENDIIFALLPWKYGWTGIKPVDLQGAMYGVEAGDPAAFSDFIRGLPAIIKDHGVTMLVCSVSRRPKGLCDPYKVMHSAGQDEDYLKIEGGETNSYGFRPRPATTALHQPAPGIFIFSNRSDASPSPRASSREGSNSTSRFLRLSSSSSSSFGDRPLTQYPRYSSSSSSSEESAGDYNYRSPRSSDESSRSLSFDTPEQNQEADGRLSGRTSLSFSFSDDIDTGRESSPPVRRRASVRPTRIQNSLPFASSSSSSSSPSPKEEPSPSSSSSSASSSETEAQAVPSINVVRGRWIQIRRQSPADSRVTGQRRDREDTRDRGRPCKRGRH